MKARPVDVDALLSRVHVELLRARTYEIIRAVGIEHRDNWITGTVESRPTDGITYTITINGGATETYGPPIVTGGT